MSPRAPKQPIFFHPGRTPGTVVVYAQAWTIAPIENAPEATDNLPSNRVNDLSEFHGVGISLHTEEFHIDEMTPRDIVTAALLPDILDKLDNLLVTMTKMRQAIKKAPSPEAHNHFQVTLASIGEHFGSLMTEPPETVLPVESLLRIEQLPYARCSLTVKTSSKAVTGLVSAFRAGGKALFLPQCGIKDIAAHPALTTSHKHLGVQQKPHYIALDLA